MQKSVAPQRLVHHFFCHVQVLPGQGGHQAAGTLSCYPPCKYFSGIPGSHLTHISLLSALPALEGIQMEKKSQVDKLHSCKGNFVLGKVNTVILSVSFRVPRGKSESFFCPRIRESADHAPPTRAEVYKEAHVLLRSLLLSDYLANKPIWEPTRVFLASSPGPWLN